MRITAFFSLICLLGLQVQSFSAEEVSKIIELRDIYKEYSLTPNLDREPVRKAFALPTVTNIHSYEFKSIKPFTDSKPKVFLRFMISDIEYPSGVLAQEGIRTFLKTANPDTGHTYAWDYVQATENHVYWISVPCLASSDTRNRLASKMINQIGDTKSLVATCSCGHGCTEKK